MSLVDYASSSDDDEPEAGNKRREQRSQLFPPFQKISGSSSSSAAIEKLPDASLLLNSPTVSAMSGSDHASRVSAAMTESASRKRESKGMQMQSNLLPRSKLPRGALPHSKNVPDTASGMLVPPQLSGRSNVVTEDINKLFVRRNKDSQTRNE